MYSLILINILSRSIQLTSPPFLDDISNNNADENDILSPPIEFNWFSGANTIRLYQEFLFLDQDKNGTQIIYTHSY